MFIESNLEGKYQFNLLALIHALLKFPSLSSLTTMII
jgi:hypothetical protein